MLRLPPRAAEDLTGALADGSLLSRFETLQRAHDGDVFRFQSPVGRGDAYLITQPDYARHVLISNARNYEKGASVDTVRMLLGNGLMTSEGDLWVAQRRKIQRGFQRASLALLLPTVASCVDGQVAEWSLAAQRGELVDITEATSRLALDVMLRTLFGRSVDVLVERMGRNPFRMLVDVPARNLDFLRQFRALDPLIIEWLHARTELDDDGDLLGMVAAGDRAYPPPMSEALMVDEVKTLLVAGHETTAAALSITWYLLACHPECFARVVAEADAHPIGQPATLEQLSALKYTRQVLREAMRLYPPGWVFARRALADDVLGSFRVPAGTDLFICPYLMHRRPDIWSDPDSFDPARFAPEREAERHPCAYLPFSVGPRHCIGEQMAMAEMLLHVSKTARAVSFAPSKFNAPELESEVNLRTKEHVYLRPLLRPVSGSGPNSAEMAQSGARD